MTSNNKNKKLNANPYRKPIQDCLFCLKYKISRNKI